MYIPYSTAVRLVGGRDGPYYKPEIQRFGKLSRILNVEMDGDEWIFILGGNTKNKIETSIPSFTLATRILTKGTDDGYTDNKDGRETQKWQMRHPPFAIQNNGVINYRNQ